MNIFDRLKEGVITESPQATRNVGSELANFLSPNSILALHGTLGVGKTTFVQGLASGFGITEQVTSPTFTLYNIHRSKNWMLVHVDGYRLESAESMDSLMVEDFLVPPWCLAIEWPEKLGSWVPGSALHLHLDIEIDKTHRHFIRLA